jgi:hypothetical protein
MKCKYSISFYRNGKYVDFVYVYGTNELLNTIKELTIKGYNRTIIELEEETKC